MRSAVRRLGTRFVAVEVPLAGRPLNGRFPGRVEFYVGHIHLLGVGLEDWKIHPVALVNGGINVEKIG